MDLPPLPAALAEIGGRFRPDAAPAAGAWLLLALVVALAVVTVPVLWRLTRSAVTIVHELGHALVGMAMGRRFTGFVVSADMSGHAITVGPRRGIGRIASTWAGYPAPALVGAAAVQIALHGWAGPALGAACGVLVASLVFTRSLHTVLAVLAAAAVTGALWWWGTSWLTALLTLAIGVFLLLGAWRHLGAVIRVGGRRDDPAQLAELTALPAWAWLVSFAAVIAAASWWAGATLWPLLRGLSAGLLPVG